MKMSILVFTFFLLQLPNRGHSHSITNDSIPEFTFLVDRNITNPSIRGYWQSIGNGYYLEVRADSILLYSYTRNFCYKEKNDYLEGLLNSQSRFIRQADTLGIYLTDYGAKTTMLQTKKDFVQVDSLPTGCLSFAEQTQLPPSRLFQLYRETIEENFAFRSRRELNWEQIFQLHRDSAGPSEYALFKTLGKIATLTKDQHTKVISSKYGEKLQYNLTPSALIVQRSFEKQTEIETFGEYVNLFFQTSYTHISDSLLRGKGQKVANGQIEWGPLDEHLGYIHIHSFSGYLDRSFTRRQQIDSLHQHMRKAISALREKEAVIVDIGFNFGGYDATALTIAGYFTDRPVHAFTSQVFHEGAFYDEDRVTIQPSDTTIAFTKPVYLLMTDISRSAAESFAMMMDALPNVTLAGNHTLGTLSGMLGKSIGSFYTTYSNQRLVNSRGHFYEATGVTPEIPITVFPEDQVLNGHLDAVRKLAKIIDKKR